jgi:hypothetical protein
MSHGGPQRANLRPQHFLYNSAPTALKRTENYSLNNRALIAQLLDMLRDAGILSLRNHALALHR